MTLRIRLGGMALLATASILTGVTPAHATPVWAPAATATIHPGVQTQTDIGQCTANFVFYDSSNNVYIGQAAHCSSTSGETVTNGCQATSLALNSRVAVGGASRFGSLVYSSWLAMQAANEPVGSNQCEYNDFALVKLDPADYAKVNPSIPFWGGPVALDTAGAGTDSKVYTYGNSSLRLGLTPLSPHVGICTNGDTGQSWTHHVYTVSPGIPGDSGSAFLDQFGRALGDLVTLSVDGSNGVSDLNHELTYLLAHSSLTSLQLALGTQAFSSVGPL